MNTNHLARLYDTLTPLERLPLVIAAGVRGDQVEQKRLSASAPKVWLQVADYYSLAKALRQAAHFEILILLDLAANFWQWWGLWMTYGLADQGAAGATTGRRGRAEAEQVQEARTAGIVRYHASRFVAHVEGWKQFCSEVHLDPEVYVDVLPGWDTITRTEKQTRRLAFSSEEAAQFVRSETVAGGGGDSLARGPVPVETVDGLAEAWHRIVAKLEQES